MVRVLAYLTIALAVLMVQMSWHMKAPSLMFALPFVLGSNLLIWRARFRGNPAVAQRESVFVKCRELKERLRVMNGRIAEIETDKQSVNQQVLQHKSRTTKEELELSAAELKTNNSNDGKLQIALSMSGLRTNEKLQSVIG